MIPLGQLFALEQRVLDEPGCIFDLWFLPEAKGNGDAEAFATQPLAFARQNGVDQSLGEALCLGPLPNGEPMELEL